MDNRELRPLFGSLRVSHALAALVAIAFALRLFELTERNFWLDEMTSLTIARQSLASILQGEGFDKHTPPFYYVLLHCWLLIFPRSEFGLRLFSAVCDSANVWLVYRVFVPQFGTRVALSSAAAWACSPFAIYFGQEARMYPLLASFTLLAYDAARTTAAEQMTAKKIALLAVVFALGAYTHYYMILVAASLTIGLLATKQSVRILKPWFISAVIGALLYLPWIHVLMTLVSSGGQSFRQFGLLVVPYALFRFSVGYGVMPLLAGMKSDLQLTILAHLPLLIAVFGIIAATLAASWSALRKHQLTYSPLLYSAAIGPLLLAGFINQFVPMLGERYLIVLYPFLLTVGIYGIAAVNQGMSRKLFCLCWLALFGFGLLGHYGNPNFQFMAWRDAAKRITQEGNLNQRLYVNEGFNKDVLQHYLPQGTEVIPISTDEAEHPAGLQRLLPEPAYQGNIILVQTETAPPVERAFHALGWQAVRDTFFPFENGLRVQVYTRIPD